MYTVKVTKECGCFKKSGMPAMQEFSDKDAALQEAVDMAEDMNTTFCQKHVFSVLENGNEILIQVAMNDR
jgi:hypothetical protein